MSTSVEVLASRATCEPPKATPLDEAVWQAWVKKCRTADRRGMAARIRVVKWVSLTVLLGTAALWSYPAPYEIAARFVVSAGAIVVMLQAFRARNYVFAALFGALVVLYNPVAPALSLLGGWQRAVVVASAIPFVVSLAWRDKRPSESQINEPPNGEGIRS